MKTPAGVGGLRLGSAIRGSARAECLERLPLYVERSAAFLADNPAACEPSIDRRSVDRAEARGAMEVILDCFRNGEPSPIKELFRASHGRSPATSWNARNASWTCGDGRGKRSPLGWPCTAAFTCQRHVWGIEAVSLPDAGPASSRRILNRRFRCVLSHKIMWTNCHERCEPQGLVRGRAT